MSKSLKFGQYLLEKKIIDELDILKARFIQKNNNLMIGELAVKKAGSRRMMLTRYSLFRKMCRKSSERLQ